MSRLGMPSAPPGQQVSPPPRGLSYRKSNFEQQSCFFFLVLYLQLPSRAGGAAHPLPTALSSPGFCSPAALSPSGKQRTSPPTPGSRTSRVFCKGREVQREFEGLTFGSWSLSRSGEGCAGSREQQSGVMSKRGMELGVARMGQGQGVPARMQ